MQKVIFLDRDGVINRKPPDIPGGDYVKSTEEFELLPGAIPGLQYLTQKNYEIYIITNQPGIGRGFMTEDHLKEIHEKFLSICKQNNVHINGIYYCPHKRDEGCECRKPKPGMLLQAAKEHNFDITKALFIGDDSRDKEAGDAAGCKTVLMEANGNLNQILQLLLK